jgi:hypothetical protein
MRRVMLVCLLVLACEKDGKSKVPDGPIPPTAIPPVTFSADSGVTDDVVKECKLQTRIPQWIADNADGAKPGPADGTPRVLTIEVTRAMATGGGAWSGPKQLIARGTLTENGQEIASFRAQRTSGGGAWGGYKGTCGILEICGEELGEDIGLWLRAPTKDALLGELGKDDDDDDDDDD